MTARKAPAVLSVIAMPEDIKDLPRPKNGPYYVVDAKRTYIVVENLFGITVTPVKSIESLPEFKPVGQVFFKHIDMPIELVGKAWHFFRSIWNERHSEAMVDITWHPTKGYRLFVPSQNCSGGGVHAKRVAEHYEMGSVTIGTMHSHCNFGASHSSIDTHDADEHDGLHITIGNVDKNPPSVAVMYAGNKVRWEGLELKQFFGTNDIPYVDHPGWWNRMVEETKRTTAQPSTALATHGSEVGIQLPLRAARRGKKNNKKNRQNDNLTYNRIQIPKEFDRKEGALLEELAGVKEFTNAQYNRLQDMIDLLAELDWHAASLGLQMEYGMFEGSILNDQKLLDAIEAEDNRTSQQNLRDLYRGPNGRGGW